VAVLLLMALAWLGLSGGVEQWPAAHSLGQTVQTVAQFAYGAFSLLVVATAIGVRTSARTLQLCWLICLTIAGGLAPSVWGSAGWATDILAGAASLGVGWAILWLLRRGARGRTRV
jgi:hypothetical protein